MEYFKAFITGGIICTIAQVLMDRTKLLPARIVVLYVVLGTLLTGLGLYQYVESFGGAGATVPIIGFGFALGEGVMKEVDKEGLIGAFTGGLKATSAGITAAILFGYLAAIIFDSKPKK
ncbi:MAG: stage V sporulation protein AE [Firmicutes bacterium HGW-Firmicutes-7]|nr:MAG: stage V sporulation protein AE [Firmicutes bacterium HGW-Firmicutes-7]